MVVSSMTVTGLNSILFVRMTLWQQVIIFVRPSLTICGLALVGQALGEAMGKWEVGRC